MRLRAVYAGVDADQPQGVAGVEDDAERTAPDREPQACDRAPVDLLNVRIVERAGFVEEVVDVEMS